LKTSNKQQKIIIIVIILLLLLWVRRKKVTKTINENSNDNVNDPASTWDGKYWTCNSHQNHSQQAYDSTNGNFCRECTDQDVAIWNNYVANWTNIYDPAMQPQPTNCTWKSNKSCRDQAGYGMPYSNQTGTAYMNHCQCNVNKPENCNDIY